LARQWRHAVARAPTQCGGGGTQELELRPGAATTSRGSSSSDPARGRQHARARALARHRGARPPPTGSQELICRHRVSPMATRIELVSPLAGAIGGDRAGARQSRDGGAGSTCAQARGGHDGTNPPTLSRLRPWPGPLPVGALSNTPMRRQELGELGTTKMRDSGWWNPLVAAHSFDSRRRATSSCARG
jgi:hypothetical protein